MAEGLVDILASDYVPRSMLDAAFMIAFSDDFNEALPTAIRTVSLNPAEVSGLRDRGEIAVGKRADLLHVGLHAGHPYIRQAWLSAQRVL